ncbi:MAG: exo-alpha-sialidase [Fimbriimonadaceae bacterium]|nr:exo-alpha-sialidase [Fimbriimonadaceae bacterium]
MGSSPDRFGPARLLAKSAGVPSAVKLPSGELLLALQWFPDRASRAWDRVAVIRSTAGGGTWSTPQPIVVAGLPATDQWPFDPTLAGGRWRLNAFEQFRAVGNAVASSVSREGLA